MSAAAAAVGDAPQDGFARVRVCGHELTACRMADVRGLIQRALDGGGAPLALATLNLDFLRLADELPELGRALGGFGHRFADGWPVIELARAAGSDLPERVTGSDLTPMICGWARESGWKLGFVGGGERTRALLAERMPRDFPGVLAGHWSPDYPPGAPIADPALARAIRDSGAQVLLVALGCPKQEYWIRDNLAASGARVAMGVGASLDFLAGHARRAPRAWRRLRLEFLWRLLCEPRRLGGRYWKDFWFYRRARRHARAGRQRAR